MWAFLAENFYFPDLRGSTALRRPMSYSVGGKMHAFAAPKCFEPCSAKEDSPRCPMAVLLVEPLNPKAASPSQTLSHGNDTEF